MQVAGSAVKQTGVGVPVAVAVVEAAVRRVVEAVTPGQRTVACRQSTTLWPLTRLEISTFRHTVALDWILSGRSSWQSPRPARRLRPLSPARFSQESGSTFKQIGDAVVDVEVLVVESADLLDVDCPGQSRAALRQAVISEPRVLA